MVIAVNKKQDEYQAFYTSCDHISGYMAKLLDCRDGMSLLEPCAGNGALLDQIINNDKILQVTALELNRESVTSLKNKYLKYDNITIVESDFALYDSDNQYDRIIANPPYGAYQTPNKRKVLKEQYPDLYAKETYGIFLIKAMEMLKVGGKLVFIIPDTFMTLHMHEGLRKRLVHDYKIESITLFPSKFFPGVNFGYAGLSIISLVNEKAPKDWCFSVFSDLQSKYDFDNMTFARKLHINLSSLSYRQIKKNSSYGFYIHHEGWITEVFSSNLPPLGSICDVVTGFYSGNDANFLRKTIHNKRITEKYLNVDENKINFEPLADTHQFDGISGDKFWVPIVKGGNKRFSKPSEWFMDWSKDAVRNYRDLDNKKSRFQNSQFYFKQGIAVPMVSSSSITGALLDDRLFDQSIVGVFPKHKYQHLLLYLLGFFNTTVCNKLIRTINASTNNSANYIKKIPIAIPDKNTVEIISTVVTNLYQIAQQKDIIESDLFDLNKIFDKIYDGIFDDSYKWSL